MRLQDPVVIVGSTRTPIGGFQGELKDVTAADLGAASIRAALERSGVGVEAIEEVVFGCVLPAGQGQAPARQAARGPATFQSLWTPGSADSTRGAVSATPMNPPARRPRTV